MLIRAKAFARAALIGNPSDGYFGKTIAFTFSKIFTTRYRAPGLRYGASVTPDGGYVRLSYDF